MPRSETKPDEGGTERAERPDSTEEDSIDAVLEATFPASDAPPWWSGRRARTQPSPTVKSKAVPPRS